MQASPVTEAKAAQAKRNTQPHVTDDAKPKRGTVNPQPLHAAQIAQAMLALKTASAVSGMSESTLRRRAADDPAFPALVRYGSRCTRVNAGAFMAWLARKAEA